MCSSVNDSFQVAVFLRNEDNSEEMTGNRVWARQQSWRMRKGECSGWSISRRQRGRKGSDSRDLVKMTQFLRQELPACFQLRGVGRWWESRRNWIQVGRCLACSKNLSSCSCSSSGQFSTSTSLKLWVRNMYQKIFLWQVRQGVTQTKQQTQPGKYANTELMKVGCYW